MTRSIAMADSDYAIVIGVDRYPTPDKVLKGAVKNALQVAEWLVKRAGVPRENLSLLLSPSPASPPVPPDWNSAFASSVTILETLYNVLEDQAGGKGERLFFYYAGHGVASRGNIYNEDAMVPAGS